MKFAVALALVLSPVAAAQAPDAHDSTLLAQGESSFDPETPAELAVERAPTGHLLVRPRINGQEAGWFIFDTGAGICVVSTAHQEPLGLAAAGQVDAVGTGGSASKGVYRAEIVTLGPITLRDHPIMTTDLSFLTPFLGREIAGVIGYGVLSRCVTEIRLGDERQSPRVALHDPAAYELASGEWTELVLHQRIPAVKARFEEHEGLFHIDTGANGWVTFNQPAVEEWKLLEGREVVGAQLGGVGGFVAAKKGSVAWFELAGLRQENVTATFATEAKGNYAATGLAGSIGGELLRPFTLVLDYEKQRIAFVRNAP
jgi:hypothetical protein